jgi:spore coat protein CotH
VSGSGGGASGASGVGGSSGAGGAAGASAGGGIGGASAGDGGMSDASEPMPSGPGTVVAEPADEAAHIYDPTMVHTFDVEISAEDLELVDSNPAAEEYVPARLTFEGESYDIGYRYKGSIGAFQAPCTGAGGRKTGKCSIKLSFNWMDPQGLFFGLRKLVFHAMNHDPSQMRERLGYALFREMGVPASRATHAILRVNGQPEIYALVEEVDGRFTRSRFSEGGEGNLYKEIWPVHAAAADYLAALETNEDQAPSADRMLRFKDAVLEGPDAMAEWVDLEVTSRYMAVDRVLTNDDGPFNFLCFSGGIGNNPSPPGNHNYYWYEAEDVDRFWLIPWDLDHAITESTMHPHIAMDWRAIPSAGQCDACRGISLPPGCDPVIQNFQSWQASYDTEIDSFIAGPFSKSAVDEKLDRWAEQLNVAGYPVSESELSELKGILDRARMNRGFPY